MAKVHDRGGRPDAGPVSKTEHQYTIWEKRTDAISQLLRGRGYWVTDENRRTMETLEPERYERLAYYERWLVSVESLLVEKGVLTSQEIEAKLAARTPRSVPAGSNGHAAEHDHEHLPGDDRPEISPQEERIDAILAVLTDKGILTADEVRAQIEYMDSRTPALGSKVVAHAWVDAAFKERLLRDAKAAVQEIGVDPGNIEQLVVLENTPTVHHMVVCTLCSCYPRPILGLPPDWYKSFAYRSRAVADPRGVLSEFGLEPEPEVEVRVVDSTADTRFLVLPMRPAGSDGLSEDQLAELVTRDCMIGVARPKAPERATPFAA